VILRTERPIYEGERVWEVTPWVFAKPIIYVLECKWDLVRKRDIDDFFEVLKWSKEFGVDTPEGRKIKQGVIGVFAGSTFNPREKVRLKDETEISLPAYAAKMNIQLLKASDFNQKLRERSIPKNVTVQRICRVARDENEVRELLDFIWKYPEKSEVMRMIPKIMQISVEGLGSFEHAASIISLCFHFPQLIACTFSDRSWNRKNSQVS